MARNDTFIEATVAEVFAVLADPYRYDDWVVGAKEIRSADASWPTPGSVFHHSVGVGPLSVRDNTKCVEVDPPNRIVLEARARPLGRARVEVLLAPEATGTRVTIDEVGTSPLLVRVLNPLLDPLIHARNAESLRRLHDTVIRSAPR